MFKVGPFLSVGSAASAGNQRLIRLVKTDVSERAVPVLSQYVYMDFLWCVDQSHCK